MKFEYFLMQRDKEHQKRFDLEQEVTELQEVLEKEQKLNQILQYALHGPTIFCSCLSSILPLQVQMLLAEIAMVEEEIICLEREVEDLKVCVYQERGQNTEYNLQQQQQLWQLQHQHFCGLGIRKEIGKVEQSPRLHNIDIRGQIHMKEKTATIGWLSEISSMPCTKINDDQAESSRRNKLNQHQSYLDDATDADSPNTLSEELMKVLISIFHKLNQTSTWVNSEPATSPRLNISCMSSRSFMSKSSFSCKTSMYCSKNTTQMLDPYGILQDGDGTARDIGSYKKFIRFTKSSLDMSRISLCLPAIRRLRVLMHKLSTVELSFMTYKQKLAFWINIYNACIMHAFLQHGSPSSSEKQLILLNKAVMNVGGIVLNALAIEHFILRHSSDTQNVFMDENEELLRHLYGLGYPEPNVTFALCRGSWSSPALRVYTAENVVNELEKAKVEYLEASIGITSKKKIFMPKLLHWHMRDFADDVESLLEWIYSQLPRSGTLKRLIMECLSRDTKVPLSKLVEIQPHEDEFRYLLPSILRS